ncbi:DUF1330 domain-containing protein [Stenotrophomonas nematodicola]|uniref:DUF1330 domain-containing protein n=1 Tax=Stenotrophomonas nematodicola TaxID=2656746 RepID=A0ABW7CVM4_9GAMM
MTSPPDHSGSEPATTRTRPPVTEHLNIAHTRCFIQKRPRKLTCLDCLRSIRNPSLCYSPADRCRLGDATAGHPAVPLAFYGNVETLEGPQVDGAVIVEFASREDARAAYDDPLYQAALKHRRKGAEYRVFIVDGVTA